MRARSSITSRRITGQAGSVTPRGTAFPANAFHCPQGPLLASLLILFQLYLAYGIVTNFPQDSLYTVGLLVFFALLYLVWKRFAGTGKAAKA